jgi:hypothetical protein
MSETSLVLELQNLAQESSTDISELIRRAKVVASKLQLSGVTSWLNGELNGYAKIAREDIPDYRWISSQLMLRTAYRNDIPMIFSTNIAWAAEHFSRLELRGSVAEIASLLAQANVGKRLTATLSPPEVDLLIKLEINIEQTVPYRVISHNALDGVLNAVRNRILDWALKLEEEGILGKGMTFSKDEKKAASSISIANNYGSFVHGDNAGVAIADGSPGANVTLASGSATVEQRLSTAVTQTEGRDAEVANALRQIADSIAKSETLSAERKEEAQEQLTFVAEQCAAAPEKRLPSAVLKPTLLALRETLGLGADVLQVWSTFGPVICAFLSVHGLV